jgi:hypothetical protein
MAGITGASLWLLAESETRFRPAHIVLVQVAICLFRPRRCLCAKADVLAMAGRLRAAAWHPSFVAGAILQKATIFSVERNRYILVVLKALRFLHRLRSRKISRRTFAAALVAGATSSLTATRRFTATATPSKARNIVLVHGTVPQYRVVSAVSQAGE